MRVQKKQSIRLYSDYRGIIIINSVPKKVIS